MMPGWGWVSCQPGACGPPMVAAAGGCEVALAGDAGGVGVGVVEVAVDGVGAAAGCGARRGAGADQVAEFAAGGVAVFAAGVVAAALGDGGEGDIEVAQQFGERGGLPGVGSVPGSLPLSGGGIQGWGPRAQPWAAAVPSGASRVMRQRVRGCREAAWSRRRVSPGSSRPQLPASPGAVDQPRMVPAGMVRLIIAGNGAGGPGGAPGVRRRGRGRRLRWCRGVRAAIGSCRGSRPSWRHHRRRRRVLSRPPGGRRRPYLHHLGARRVSGVVAGGVLARCRAAGAALAGCPAGRRAGVR